MILELNFASTFIPKQVGESRDVEPDNFLPKNSSSPLGFEFKIGA